MAIFINGLEMPCDRKGKVERLNIEVLSTGEAHAYTNKVWCGTYDAIEVSNITMRGRWEYAEMGYYKCSACGVFADEAFLGKFRFCPACGTKMDIEHGICADGERSEDG